MAEGRRYALNPQLDLQQILLEARSRWLRPSEICEILRNYHMFNITPDPPYKPPGGSLFLFDRKALRYFRKDGHRWRKKKDGKTVREAHEKLKSGSVDVLHCYYAHGEDNENFQRRSYWMLDGKLEHIVLVHYRDLSEGNSPGVPQFQGAQITSVVGSSHTNSSTFMNHTSYASSTSNADWNAQTTSTEFEDADSGDEFGSTSPTESVFCSRFQVAPLPGNSNTDHNSVLKGSVCHPYGASLINSSCLNKSMSPLISNHVASQNLILTGAQNVHGASHDTGSFGLPFDHNSVTPTWSEFLSLKQKLTDTAEQKMSFRQRSCFNALNIRPTDSISQNGERIEFGLQGGYKVLPEPYSQPFTGDGIANVQVKEENAPGANHPVDNDIINKDSVHMYDMSHEHQLCLAPRPKTTEHLECKTEVPSVLKNIVRQDICDDGLGELKKLDSFGRWMDKELGKDCDDSLMAADSCTYWNAIDTQNHDKEISSLSRHMQLDVDSVAPSLSQEQLFSILDFSPDWAYSEDGAKILISGVFLGKIQPKSIKWCCMFGEVEVMAELLTTNSIRCQAPAHRSGRVPFYITCSNRLACSEVREFEYRENPSCTEFSFSRKQHLEDEMYLQIQFAKILSLGSDKKRPLCSVENCDKCSIKKILFQLLVDEAEWEKIEEVSKTTSQGCRKNIRDALLEKLLKGRLYEWLARKLHEDGKGPSILDDEGQGAIHLAAALGYEWAMTAIVSAGVHPSLRDVRGRTALHWAAYYGREQALVTLLKLGAAPGAVEDPTLKFPQGQTAADLASSSGHKGIAGYLAEADLTSHLVSMSLSENVMDSVAATLASKNTIKIAEEQNIVSVDGKCEQTSLRESLAAVRNSVEAAARIQAAFRVQSFLQQQSTITVDTTKISDEMMALPFLFKKIHRIGRFNDSLHAAAIKIQQKYRGWKGRKEFRKIRDRIVNIQAHVRGHQVRKQYRRIVWSVGIVEKVILRWRRKRSGLRGFRAEKANVCAEQEVERTDEYEFFHLGRKQKVAGIEKALARVRSMVRYPEARDQYMRLVACSNKSELRIADCSSECSCNVETSLAKDSLAPLMN